MFLDYFALGLLFFVAIVLFYGIIAIHDIPYEMAKKRNHPQQDAIHVAGWVSLLKTAGKEQSLKEKDSNKASKKDRDAKVKERGKLKRKDYEKQLRKLQAEPCAVQEWRFRARIEDPVRQWKLSAMDLPSRERWNDYSRARDQMLDATDTDSAPRNIVHLDHKKRARQNLITHLLKQSPYEPIPREEVKLPKWDMKHAYDDEANLAGRRWIPERF